MAPVAQPTIALFAKYPAAGAAKTRLIPTLGPEGAAQVHRLLVERTVTTIRASGLPFTLYFTGANRATFAEWLGDDVPLAEQCEGDLGARLTRVPAPAILLGADVPGLTAVHLQQAVEALEHSQAVLGPAQDGGYYLLGFRQHMPFVFTEMPWGTDAVFRETLARLKTHNISFAVLEMLADCDRPADLALFPDLLP